MNHNDKFEIFRIYNITILTKGAIRCEQTNKKTVVVEKFPFKKVLLFVDLMSA